MGSERLSAREIAAHGGIDESRLLVFETIGSTNATLLAMAREGAPAGRVVLAEHQSAGRGRMGRSFFSPEGRGLYMSLLLRPKRLEAGKLTTLAAVVTAEAIFRICGIQVGIKWVNDLIFDGKKLCGILAEGIGTDLAVLGIGINAEGREFPPELQTLATSLEAAAGRAPDRNLLAAEILKGFENADIDGISHMEEYRRRCLTIGKRVILLPSGETADALAVEDDGALLIRDESGKIRRVFSGEVSVRSL